MTAPANAPLGDVEVARRETIDPTRHDRLVKLLAELVAKRRQSGGG